MSCRNARWYLRNRERVPDAIVAIVWRSCFISCFLQGCTLISTKQRTKGSFLMPVAIVWRSCFMSCVLQGRTQSLRNSERRVPSWCQSCYSLNELFYELCPAGTHADIYETEDGGRCVLDAGGYIFNSEAHPIDPAALGDCIFYCKDTCWGSLTFLCGSGSADPHLWLMGPDPFFSDFKEAKKFYTFFLKLTPSHIIFSLSFFAKVLC